MAVVNKKAPVKITVKTKKALPKKAPVAASVEPLPKAAVAKKAPVKKAAVAKKAPVKKAATQNAPQKSQWKRIEDFMKRNKDYVPSSMIAKKTGIENKFVSSILCAKSSQSVGLVDRTPEAIDFKGYRKALGFRLANNNDSKQSA